MTDTSKPTPGSIWEHKNGNRYTVLCLANESSANPRYQPVVVYQGDNGRIWARHSSDWHRSFIAIPKDISSGKPTPGPWHVVCTPGHNGIGEVRVYSSDMGLPIATVNSNWPGRTVDAAFIAEAGTVYHETNLTPRQLLEQRNELLNAVEGFIKSFHHSVITDDLEQFPAMAAGIAAMNKARGIPEGCTHTFICEHPNWPNGIWEIDPVSALAKCGKVGVK